MALLAVYYFPQAPRPPVAQKWACGTSYRERGVKLWPIQASDGEVRDDIFLGTSVPCVVVYFSTEYAMGVPPIVFSASYALTTQGSLCETARFALCRLRDLSCLQAPPASPTRATLALVFPAGWGQTRHVDRPTHPQRYGYVAG